ncbi:hypothetical protein ABK040_010429 [Willaertia magna]
MQSKSNDSNSGGYYQRDLPKSLIAFSSMEGREIFKECLNENNLHAFFPLIEQFHTQSEPAYCGLGTLVMVLNSLKIDPNRLWKYPWRWFSEELLDCCVPLDIVKKEGLTLEQFQCLARCNNAICELHRPQQSSLEEFRNAIKNSIKSNNPEIIFSDNSTNNNTTNTTNNNNQIEQQQQQPPSFVVVSYDRQSLEQTGSGHFSPIAAYNEKKDMVLVLDVARFKYPPYWTTVEMLWKSLFPIDSSTGLSRGYFVLKKNNRLQSELSICCRVVMKEEWTLTISNLLNTTLEITKDFNENKNLNENLDNLELFISCFVKKLKDKVFTIIELFSSDNDQHLKIVKELEEEVKKHFLFKQMKEQFNLEDVNAALLTILLLSLPFYFFDNDPQIIEGLKELQKGVIVNKRDSNNYGYGSGNSGNSGSSCSCKKSSSSSSLLSGKEKLCGIEGKLQQETILSSHISHLYSQFSALSDMMNKTNKANHNNNCN